MELYAEILTEILVKHPISNIFPELKLIIQNIVKMECYKALQEIKTIITDDSFSDRECFDKIEQIVCALENIGVDCANRHDFG